MEVTGTATPKMPAGAISDDMDERDRAITHSMVAAGQTVIEHVQVDYFGMDETKRFTLPDGVSWFEHQVLNEGARRKYQNSTTKDVRVQKVTGDAILRMAAGEEKVALLKAAITNFNLTFNGQPFPFNPRNLDTVLEKFPPKIIDLIHKEIVKANPWLLAEMSSEDIKKEIENLQEMLETKLIEEEGKAGS